MSSVSFGDFSVIVAHSVCDSNVTVNSLCQFPVGRAYRIR